MAELWLLCEGKTDLPVLASVLVSVLGTQIIPKSAGGSGNAPKAAEYLRQNHRAVTVSYIIDRDYRRREVAEATFTDGRACFIWRRHSVENYLLEPAIIIAALRDLRASLTSAPGGIPAWLQTPPGEREISTTLRACAEERAPQEAARIALQRLWDDLSDTAGQIQLRQPLALRQDAVDEALCRQALAEEASRLCDRALALVDSPQLTAAALDQRYDAELRRVRDPAYLDQREFLKDFHGKDLLRCHGLPVKRTGKTTARSTS